MKSLARLLIPFQVLGTALGSDSGVPLLVEYGGAERVMCQVCNVVTLVTGNGVNVVTLLVIKKNHSFYSSSDYAIVEWLR